MVQWYQTIRDGTNLVILFPKLVLKWSIIHILFQNVTNASFTQQNIYRHHDTQHNNTQHKDIQ
jgi:hypothetical protein